MKRAWYDSSPVPRAVYEFVPMNDSHTYLISMRSPAAAAIFFSATHPDTSSGKRTRNVPASVRSMLTGA